ncbi:MAG TPA: sugar phosphate isomerase/epimerase family protein [Candidatus Hydrogenedentes bacterium]|nr:sugar phosphate isomerase/epimerase family protein [Candidatus Hydrogenedentota bacterium]
MPRLNLCSYMPVNSRIALIVLISAAVMAGAALAADSGMYVSVRDGMVGGDTFASPIEGLKHLGVDAVELNLARDFSVQPLDGKDKVILKTDEDAKAFRQNTEKLGIRICSVLTACDFSAGDMESNTAWIARAIEIADLLGASAVRIDSAMAKERELDFEARVKLFAEGLTGALQRTANSKVALGIENHGFQGNNLAFLLNVFQLVGSDRLGSTLDTGNFYWRGYPLSEVYGILRVLAPYAKHTHVKNIHYPEDQREIMREAGWKYSVYFCPLDEGDISIAKVVDILAKAGYKGDICVEDESISKCKTPAEKIAVLERDVACIKKAIAEVK